MTKQLRTFIDHTNNRAILLVEEDDFNVLKIGLVNQVNSEFYQDDEMQISDPLKAINVFTKKVEEYETAYFLGDERLIDLTHRARLACETAQEKLHVIY